MAHVSGHLGHSSLRQSLFGDGRSCLPVLCDCRDLVDTTVFAIIIAAGIFGNDCYRVFPRISLAKVPLGKLWHVHP